MLCVSAVSIARGDQLYYSFTVCIHTIVSIVGITKFGACLQSTQHAVWKVKSAAKPASSHSIFDFTMTWYVTSPQLLDKRTGPSLNMGVGHLDNSVHSHKALHNVLSYNSSLTNTTSLCWGLLEPVPFSAMYFTCIVAHFLQSCSHWLTCLSLSCILCRQTPSAADKSTRPAC